MNISHANRLVQIPQRLFNALQWRSSTLFILIIFLALIAFEAFNYSTADYALRDLFGELSFVGLRWSTILALAFCGMDFAGIARLLSTPDEKPERHENWYLLGAWLMAATMNTGLTWWGVSMAIYNHPVQSIVVVDPMTIVTFVPIFVAAMVWILRILIIGSLLNSLNHTFRHQKKTTPQPRPSTPLGFRVKPMATPSGEYIHKPVPPAAQPAQKLPESFIPLDQD